MLFIVLLLFMYFSGQKSFFSVFILGINPTPCGKWPKKRQHCLFHGFTLLFFN